MAREEIRAPREKARLFYSIFILLAIPLLIAVNTLGFTGKVRNNYDAVNRQNAEQLNSVIVVAARDNVGDANELQNILTRIRSEQQEITRINVLISTPDPTQFKIFASTEDAGSGMIVRAAQYGQVVASKNAATQLATDKDQRVWRVVSPLTDESGGVLALVESDVSLKESDQLINATVLTSAGVAIATMILTSLLLLGYFKLTGYSKLVRKIQEVDQLRSNFLAVIAEQLHTPMTAIKGNIENLMNGHAGSLDEKAKTSIQAIQNETSQINSLVEDLQNVSKIEQEEITYTLQPVDVRDIIDQLVKTFKPQAEQKGLELRYDRPEQEAVVSADKSRLIEVLTNLIDNAIKYTQKGSVVVAHRDDQDTIRISVKDTGVGIVPEARGRLFTRFYRIQNNSAEGTHGAGLGLWLTSQYVEHIGGEIDVDSTEGSGSDFVVSFKRIAGDISKPTVQLDDTSG